MSATNLSYQSTLDWLLEPEDPGVRYLTLRDLLSKPTNDPELVEARENAYELGPIARILDNMQPEGWWSKAGPGYSPKYRSTVWALILLAQLGASVEQDERVAKACNYLLEHAYATGGYMSHNGAPGGTFDCLQGNLCWALTELGFEDPRLDEAYHWLAISQTGEGVASKTERDAKVRYYVYKCGPGFQCGANYNLPCAWGATKVLMALGAIPPEKQSKHTREAIQLAVDFFFSVEPTSAAWPYKDGINNTWWKFGYPAFYNTDLLQVAEALVEVGYGNDPRLATTLELIRSKQDAQGRWKLEHDYPDKTWGNYGKKGHPNKWVTLRALRVVQKVEK
jgi:hypothetical protein